MLNKFSPIFMAHSLAIAGCLAGKLEEELGIDGRTVDVDFN